jgi:uncharacterized membrane protein
MSPSVYSLVLTAHVLGFILWISGLTAIFWMLRFHDHAPKSSHVQLTLQERALALATDLAATVAMVCGLVMAIGNHLFTVKPNMWLHVKLTAVVLLILPVHGMLRAKIAKYSRGELKPAPTWLWSMLLAGVLISVFCAVTKLNFLPAATAP